MATRKGQSPQLPKSKSAARSNAAPADVRSAEPVRDEDRVPVEINDLVAQRKHNADKPSEHGREGAARPPEGEHFDPPSYDATGSSVSEANDNDKTGSAAAAGEDATPGPLSKVRNDATGQRLTTNQGVPVSQNQDTLKAGVRGPGLLKDFILREKLTHFDHERIPERIVHARGSAAHGYFEAYESLADITRAGPALGRATAARGDCPRAGYPAVAAAGRRAHRKPGHEDGCRGV